MSTSKISSMGLGQSPGNQRPGQATELRLLIDSAPALIHTSLPDGYLDFFNETWLKYVGRSLEDLLGWRWTEYIHPDDLDGIVQKWRASLASGEPFLHETRVRRADGEYRWMLHHKVAVRDEHGNIVKWHGSSIDIEDRKRAEEALQQSQFYLAEGQRLAHMGSWAFSATAFEYWSPELFRIYGLDPNGKPPTVEEYLALVHPEDRAFMKQGIATMLEDHRAFDFTKRIVRPDGEIRSVRCVGVPVTQGGTFQGFLGTGMDVTEQEQLTQELQRREAYLAEAQRLSHTGSFGWKPDSGEIVWSDETYRIFEYDPTVKITIDSIAQRVHPEDRAEFQKVIDGASAGATRFEHAYRLLLPDGRIKHIHALAHATLDASGNREFVGAGIDVTVDQTSRRGTAPKRGLSGGGAETQQDGQLGMESRPGYQVLVGGMLPCSEFRSTGWFAPIRRLLSADSSGRPTRLQGTNSDRYPREGRVGGGLPHRASGWPRQGHSRRRSSCSERVRRSR